MHNLTPYDPEYQQRLAEITAALAVQNDPATAADQAQQVLYAIVQRQAMLLAFVDNFRLISLLCLACIPLVLLFRKVRTGPSAVGAH